MKQLIGKTMSSSSCLCAFLCEAVEPGAIFCLFGSIFLGIANAFNVASLVLPNWTEPVGLLTSSFSSAWWIVACRILVLANAVINGVCFVCCALMTISDGSWKWGHNTLTPEIAARVAGFFSWVAFWTWITQSMYYHGYSITSMGFCLWMTLGAAILSLLGSYMIERIKRKRQSCTTE